MLESGGSYKDTVKKTRLLIRCLSAVMCGHCAIRKKTLAAFVSCQSSFGIYLFSLSGHRLRDAVLCTSG